jgi:hypothetical protein
VIVTLKGGIDVLVESSSTGRSFVTTGKTERTDAASVGPPTNHCSATAGPTPQIDLQSVRHLASGSVLYDARLRASGPAAFGSDRRRQLAVERVAS